MKILSDVYSTLTDVIEIVSSSSLSLCKRSKQLCVMNNDIDQYNIQTAELWFVNSKTLVSN